MRNGVHILPSSVHFSASLLLFFFFLLRCSSFSSACCSHIPNFLVLLKKTQAGDRSNGKTNNKQTKQLCNYTRSLFQIKIHCNLTMYFIYITCTHVTLQVPDCHQFGNFADIFQASLRTLKIILLGYGVLRRIGNSRFFLFLVSSLTLP